MKLRKWAYVQVMTGTMDDDPISFRHHWVTAASEDDAYTAGHAWADATFGTLGQSDVMNDYVLEEDGV